MAQALARKRVSLAQSAGELHLEFEELLLNGQQEYAGMTLEQLVELGLDAFGDEAGFTEAVGTWNRTKPQREPAETGQALALAVYGAVYASTESFEQDHIGADLAYLMHAILQGEEGCCEWPEGRPILGLLRQAFASCAHPVWRHIRIVDP